MNSPTQPGHHPDADQLTAFAEHALPLHEQKQTLAHLATCADCRAIVTLAQPPVPAELPLPEPVAAWHAWFPPWDQAWRIVVRSAVVSACLVGGTLYLRRAPAPRPQQSVMTASLQPTQVPLAEAPSVEPHPAESKAIRVLRATQGPRPSEAVPATPTMALKQAPRASVAAEDSMTATAARPAPVQLHGALASLRFSPGTNAAIGGLVTDPSGAAISRARITATNTITGLQLSGVSSGAGSFSLSPVQPGQYKVEAAAPGFQKLLQENIQVAPRQQVALNMKLPIGSASQSIAVSTAAPALDTANATMDAIVAGAAQNQTYANLPVTAEGRALAKASKAAAAAAPPPMPPALMLSAPKPAAKPQTVLPSHLPTVLTVANAGQTLAIDAAGALFRSQDAGVTWLPIASQWQGRATHLALSATTGFELTTDTNRTYTSADGQTWRIK